MKRSVLRVIDVNFNRAREGLRVCEEVTRFVLNSKTLTADVKKVRHRIRNIGDSFPKEWKGMIASRDSASDVGRAPSGVEMKRRGPADIFAANMRRAEEAARVLEEFLKLFDGRLSNRFKRIRFDLYEIERKALKRL